MKRSARLDFVAAVLPIPLVSFGSFLWLFRAYVSSHPTRPNVDLGFTHALNNHGYIVYISEMEVTGLSLLMLVFFFGIALVGIITPKDGVVKPVVGPQGKMYFPGPEKDKLSLRQGIIAVCSIAFYIAFIVFLGPALIFLLISKGVVLHLFI